MLLLWQRTSRNCRAEGIPTPFPKTKAFKIFVAAIVVSDVCILIRAIYRLIELSQGWRGYLITTEPWTYGLDGALMVICMAVWIFGHPGVTLGKELATSKLRSENNSASDIEAK